MAAAYPLPDLSAPEFFHLVDQLPLIVWTSELELGNGFLNQHWFTYTGLTVAESTGQQRWARALHPDDHARTFAEWNRVRETGEAFDVEYRLRRHDGQYRWFLGRAQALRDAQGHLRKWFGTCTDIHDQKEAQEDFTALADTIPQLVWATDPAGSHLYFNQRWAEFTGLTMAESLGPDVWNRTLHPDDQARARERWGHALRTGELYEIEYRFRRYDGEYRWFLGRAEPVRGEHGHITKWFGTCTDIHEARQRDLHLRRLLESQVVGVLFYDVTSPTLPAVNDRFLALVGRSREELEAGRLDWQTLTPPEYAHKDETAIAELRATGTHSPYEKELLRPDGSRVPVLLAGSLIEGTQGVSLCIDLTDLRRAETTLREREQELDTLANNIPQLAWMADPTGHIFWYNRRWYAYTDTTFAEMEGWGWEKVHHPEHIGRVVERWSAALKAGTPWEDTFPLRGADGRYRWFLSRAEPIRDGEGRIVRWFGSNADVTEQRLLQDQLHSAYADLETKITFRTLDLERQLKELRGKA